MFKGKTQSATASRDQRPHSKRHMLSPFGRVVDRATYVDLLFLACVVMLSSSVYFWLASSAHGLKEHHGLLGSAYFTLVTFTSLGYGDLSPQGLGRFVAVGTVLSGLALTAVFIGKVASERQFAMLMLLHTSDTQRRIAGFSDQMSTLRERMSDRSRAHDANGLQDVLKEHIRLSKALKSYLVFNSHQAVVLEFGNFTALIGLYDEIRASFHVMRSVYREDESLGDAIIMQRLLSNMSELSEVAARMNALHHHRKPRTAIWRSVLEATNLIGPPTPATAELSAKKRVEALKTSLDRFLAEARGWNEAGYHAVQVERVLNAFPAQPRAEWPTGIHKRIARKLGISNSVATKCVDELLKTGRLPKMAKPGADQCDAGLSQTTACD